MSHSLQSGELESGLYVPAPQEDAGAAVKMPHLLDSFAPPVCVVVPGGHGEHCVGESTTTRRFFTSL
jgi:hypothetical protein